MITYFYLVKKGQLETESLKYTLVAVKGGEDQSENLEKVKSWIISQREINKDWEPKVSIYLGNEFMAPSKPTFEDKDIFIYPEDEAIGQINFG